MTGRPFTYAALATALLVWAAGASAQDGLFDISEDDRNTFLDLGGAVVSRAAYVGSEETDTDVFPYLAFEYEGRVFGNAAQGLGVNLINRDGLQVAATGFYASGRDTNDTPFGGEVTTPELEEAFDLGSSFTAGGLVSYRFPYAQAELQAQVPVTGDVEGWRLDASLATRIPPLEKMLGEGTIIAPGVRATYLDDEWTESYYGVTTAQAVAAGLPVGYDADGGFNSYSLFGLTSITLASDITLVGVANYTFLAGDAKDSPLSPDNNGLTLVAGIAKRF